MPKFARLLVCLREHGLLVPTQEFVPEPAPRAWLELAHRSDYVAACSSSASDEAALRRLGLPMSPVLALRSRCAVAGTRADRAARARARPRLQHRRRQPSCFRRLRRWLLRLQRRGGGGAPAPGRRCGAAGAGGRPRRAPGRRDCGDAGRRAARVHALGPLPRPTSRRASSRATSTWRSMPRSATPTISP